MKKMQIIGLILAVGILAFLIIFASTRKYSDSHLRSEGKRVRVESLALYVEECDEETQNAIKCEKTIKVGDKKELLTFEFFDIKDNGYPNSVKASINGKVYFEEEGLNIETNGGADYRYFLNFNVIDDEVITYTMMRGNQGRSTVLYAIDLEGNILLEESEIDEEDMLIKDNVEYITYEDNTIKIYASRVLQDMYYQDKDICEANSKDIVEAYYTYTYEDGVFTKKQSETTTAKEFIEDKKITCSDES